MPSKISVDPFLLLHIAWLVAGTDSTDMLNYWTAEREKSLSHYNISYCASDFACFRKMHSKSKMPKLANHREIKQNEILLNGCYTKSNTGAKGNKTK